MRVRVRSAHARAGEPSCRYQHRLEAGNPNPPGNLAYNVTQSALRTYTEGLQHELRNTEGCRVTAHLLIPSWTTTGKKEHKPGPGCPIR
jgi:hypothetical protein